MPPLLGIYALHSYTIRQMNFFKSILLTIVLAVMAALPSWGQEYEVASFELRPKDLTARTGKPRIDGNGRKCAVLKVQVNDRIAAALGNVVGEITNMGMEKWIYVAHDTKQLELAFDNHYPLTLTFEDYDFPTLSQQMVYVVRLREKDGASGTPAQAHPQPAASPAQPQPATQPQSVAQPATQPQPVTQPQASNPTANESKAVDEILNEAIAAYEAKKYEQALALFREIDHDAVAQNYLGFMYQKGYAVRKDYNKAVMWFSKSAEQGNANAQNNLGYMYDMGLGVFKSYSVAVKWYRKAAEQGNAFAENNLGYMYENGLGVKKDYAEAVKWYGKAAEQGNARAQNNLGEMYRKGYGVKKDYAEAVSWFRKAAEQGNANAQNNLGWCYYNGKGVPKDRTKAIEWWKKAADFGHVEAMKELRKIGESF